MVGVVVRERPVEGEGRELLSVEVFLRQGEVAAVDEGVSRRQLGCAGEVVVQRDGGGAEIARRLVVLLRLVLSMPVSITVLLSCGAMTLQLPPGTAGSGHCAGGGRCVEGVAHVPFGGGVGGGVVRNALRCGCIKEKKEEARPDLRACFTWRDSGLNEEICRSVNVLRTTGGDSGEGEAAGAGGPQPQPRCMRS